MAYKGRYRPRNPEKYEGDPTQIVFRSSWEVRVMRRLDLDPSVAAWSSESVVIPYHDRASGRSRRYFVDFWFRRVDGKKFLVEVKPLRETVPPSPEGKSQARFMRECMTYATNRSKWEAAERWCARRNTTFVVITERELGIKG